MVIAAALPLCACIAQYKHASEEKFSAAPDLGQACRYQWKVGPVEYRLHDRNDFAWTDVANRGYPSLRSDIARLAANCPADKASYKAEASVSAHYLEFSNQANRRQMMLPVVFLEIFSMGLMPMEMTNYYAVCVETDVREGPRRAAMARGHIDAATNVWGGTQSVFYAGGALREESRQRLLRELAQQAWHKVWLQQELLPAGSTCRNTLNAMVDAPGSARR